MKHELHLGAGLTLPADAVTQTFGFLGRKGSGKTYAAGVLVEALLSQGVQVVVLDPLGNWYGLRLDRSGKRPSRFPIPILGGEHGDVPLEVKAGALVADFVVSTGSSAVLDVSGFRKGQRKEFVADFCEELFHKKKAARTPLHLVIEEAQVFAPQRAGRGEERMLGAVEDIVRLGRNVGIGVSMISQRPQSVNKEVLNQAEPLVVFQLVAKQERDAVAAWMEHVGAQLKEAAAALPSLHTGDCYFWSPAWLRTFKQTRFVEKVTFDASATPKAGAAPQTPDKLAPVDLAKLHESMAATIERAKADDPKTLRAEIAKLKKELAAKPAAPAKVERIETPVLKPAELARIEQLGERVRTALGKAAEQAADLVQRIDALAERAGKLTSAAAKAAPVTSQSHAGHVQPVGTRIVERLAKFTAAIERQHAHQPHPGLSHKQQQILDALAWWESIGVPAPSNAQLGAIALIDASGGYFSNVVGPLVSSDLVERGGGAVRLTDAGRSAARPLDAVASLDDYHQVLRERVRRAKSSNGKTLAILDAVIAAGGEELTNEQIGEAVGIDVSGGYFSNSIGPLSTLGLIERRGGVVRPTELVFPPGL